MAKVYLLAIDGSPNARMAEAYLADFVKSESARVVVISVVRGSAVHAPSSAFISSSNEGAIMAMLQEMEAAAQREVTEVVERLKQSMPCEGFVVHGEVREQILKQAEAHNADFIVMGARGLGAVKRLLLGSVTTHVLHNGKRPVIIVKNAAVTARPRRFVCAVDESAPSQHALKTLLEIAKRGDHVSVVAVHVPFVSLEDDIAACMGDEDSRNERCAAALLKLQQSYMPLCEAAGLQCAALLRQGDPRTVICDEVESIGADMLVMGARGAGLLGRLILGSVSSYCAHNAAVNAVLVVTGTPAETAGPGAAAAPPQE